MFQKTKNPLNARVGVAFWLCGKIARFLCLILVCSQKYEGFLKFFLLLYPACSQIWLNCLMDDCHLNYFKKIKKMKINARTPTPTQSGFVSRREVSGQEGDGHCSGRLFLATSDRSRRAAWLRSFELKP